MKNTTITNNPRIYPKNLNARVGLTHNLTELEYIISHIGKATAEEKNLDFQIENIKISPILKKGIKTEKYSVIIQAKSTVPSLSNLKIWLDEIKNHCNAYPSLSVKLVIHINYQAAKK